MCPIVCFMGFLNSYCGDYILQESIIKQVNENPEAGWKAGVNPRFSNVTVSIQIDTLTLMCLLRYEEHIKG